MPRLGMLGMEERIVRVHGSKTKSYTGWVREENRLLGSGDVSDMAIRAAAVVGDVDDRRDFWRGPSW